VAGGRDSVEINAIEASIDSTMKPVKIDHSDPTPLHDQVAAQIRRSIAEGDAAPGDRLPPAKDMAAVLEVHSNTVLRALRQLREEGLLEFRRGLGGRVAGTPERGIVLSKAHELLALARHHGYQPDELIQIIRGLG
jgi:GntR family transcriptional regulator